MPVAHPPRKIPVAQRDRFKTELYNMELFGVITRESRPTDSVNSMVVVNEKEKLQACLDPLL